MRQLKSYTIWAMAALLSVYTIGCACQNDECGGKVNLRRHRPTVTFVTPANTETGVATNRKIAANFSEAMNTATINPATFLVTGPGLVPVPGTIAHDTVNLNYVFTPDSTLLLPNTTYTATITTGAENPRGASLAVPFVWTFTTGATADNTRPTVIFVNPAALAIGVPINTAVTATFSEVMDPTTLTTATFTVTGAGATPVSGAVSYIGTTATFTPASDLAISTLYTATITTGAKDLAGNALAVDFVWTFTTGTTKDTTRPTVILVNPANHATGVPLNAAVNATFSEAMNPGTIITANFTLTGPGGTTVIGIVTYNLLTDIATFTPFSPLALDTKYTATITTGVQDLAGNHMLNHYVWSFTTSTLAELSPSPIALGAVANFAIVAGGGISDVPTSAITGDIGVSPASGAFITGFSVPTSCPEVNGKIYEVDAAGPACAVTDVAGLLAARGALTTAYNVAAGLSVPAPTTVSGDQGGTTLPPGIYKSTSSLSIASGDLTLDAQGDGNAVWIFQIASTLTTVGCGASVPCTTGGNVMLIGGAVPANVFWQVGSSATIGQYTIFNGTILAYQDISINTGAEIHGRLLSGAIVTSGAVTLISDIVVIPPYIN